MTQPQKIAHKLRLCFSYDKNYETHFVSRMVLVVGTIMFRPIEARTLFSLITIYSAGFILRVLCDGSTFSPVSSPLGENVYITDYPTVAIFDVTLAGCASQCMFYSNLHGGSSGCRCFNYDSHAANCSLFTFEPTRIATDSNGFVTAYQVVVHGPSSVKI